MWYKLSNILYLEKIDISQILIIKFKYFCQALNGVGDDVNAQRVLLKDLYQTSKNRIKLAVSIGGHDEIPSLTEGGVAEGSPKSILINRMFSLTKNQIQSNE